MPAIWKYMFKVDDSVVVPMKVGAQILSVASQGEHIIGVWAIVDPDLLVGLEDRWLVVRGTGHPFQGNEGRFLGTVLDGMFVWHVFEEK